MKIFHWILNFIVAAVCVIFQQALIIFLGVVVYDATSLIWATFVWLLCLPMIYLNYYTINYIFRFGVINFLTMNADTSQIDVQKEDRWYNQ